MKQNTRPEADPRILFGENLPKSKRKPHHNATWPVAILLCILISLIGVVLAYVIIGKAAMNKKCDDLWVWMARPGTVFTLEADGVAKTITNQDFEMRQLEIILMDGENYKLPVSEENEAITLTIENDLGQATLVLWLQENGVAMRWQPPGERPFTGQLLGHRQKVAFRHLRELISTDS